VHDGVLASLGGSAAVGSADHTGRRDRLRAAALGALAALGTTGSTPFWSLGVSALAVTVVYQLVKAPEVGA
jgi:hypothetical protein